MSQELQQYLRGNGVATSRTTPYNTAGNSQVEQYNGIIWKAILLSLKSQNLEVKNWETVLPVVLTSIRSLLSTATNMTPHEPSSFILVVVLWLLVTILAHKW